MKAVWEIILDLFGVFAFVGVGAGVFFGLIKPPMEAKNILKNGTETTATVISLHCNFTKISSVTNGSVAKTTEDAYYSLKLSFINAAGEEVTVKTNSIYPEQFITKQGIASKNKFSGQYDVIEKETVQIMYKGNKAILKGFVPDKGEGWLWLFPIVFGAIGIGLFIASLFAFMNVISSFKLKKYGTDGIGIYLKHEITPSKNGTKYGVYFTFQNEQEQHVEVKTDYIYEEYEAEALKAMQSFPIKFIGDKAIIVVEKSVFLQYKVESLRQTNFTVPATKVEN